MIVDDRRAICGSSSSSFFARFSSFVSQPARFADLQTPIPLDLNDRSMCGDHDSEIAIVVEDLDMVETTSKQNHILLPFLLEFEADQPRFFFPSDSERKEVRRCVVFLFSTSDFPKRDEVQS